MAMSFYINNVAKSMDY